MVYPGKDAYYLKNLGQNSSHPVHYNEVLTYLINNISTEASYDPSKRMFVTGEIKFSTVTIYGLVQCTRDMSEDKCHFVCCLPLEFLRQAAFLFEVELCLVEIVI